MFEDHRNTPAAKFVHWNHAIATYVKSNQIFHCPSSKWLDESRPAAMTDLKGRRFPRRDTSYAYEYMQVNDMPDQFDEKRAANTQMSGSAESKIVAASTTILNYDRPWSDEEYDDGSVALIDPENITSSCNTSVPVVTMHSGGGNFSFIDGHVKWMNSAQLGDFQCAQKTR
ncbi:hypothetical protein EON80_09855 [bacterium]|nr:MAG: hypothetical protein EON80_09855 [bacterium]